MARLFACSAALLLSTASSSIDWGIEEKKLLANMPMIDAMTENVKSKIAQGGKVLDLGAGLGEPTTSLAIALPNSRITSTDLQEAMVEKAKLRVGFLSNVDFAVTSADDLSAYPDNTFAAVTMSHTLMFVPDKAKSIAEIARVLQPGGHAFIAVWQDLRVMSELFKGMTKILGKKPPPTSQNPMALSGPSAVEDLVKEAGDKLEVLTTEFLIYPIETGDDKGTCELAKMVVGESLKELESSGENPDATEEFCDQLIARLKGEGYQNEEGKFSFPGNVAQLMVLRKPAAGTKHGGEI